MKKSNLAVMGLVAGLGLMGQAYAGAFLVDDFNVTDGASVIDSTIGTPVDGAGSPRSQGTVMNQTGGLANWDRSLHAELLHGDEVSTVDCQNCQAGHVIADAGLTLSYGKHYFDWTGPSTDLSAYTNLLFDWSSDASGAGTTAWAVFFDDVAATAQSASITLAANTSLTTYSIVLPDFTTTGQGWKDITGIELWFDGSTSFGNGVSNGGYDGNIDNVRFVPEPGTLALIGLGFAALGWNRRRINRVLLAA